jgi:phosphatidate phosphatase
MTSVKVFDINEELNEKKTSRNLLKKSELKNRIIQTVFDFIIICCNFFIFAMVYFLVNPKIAYFTCDMSDISYPYKSNTIDEFVVDIYGVLGGILVIIFVEIYNGFYINSSNDILVSEKLKTVIVCSLHAISLFILGISATLMMTEIGKRWIGRLRPHFLSVCAPNYSSISCYTSTSTGYIYNSISTADPFCTGDASKVKEVTAFENFYFYLFMVI